MICGLEEPTSFHCKRYHANFLASTQLDAVMTGDAATTTPVRRLFLAEFWKEEPHARIFGKPKVSICCPIQDITCFGRCTYCENRASNIVHPPYGNDDTADMNGNLYSSTLRRLDFKNNAVPESDFIYLFDHEEDEKVAEILRQSCHGEDVLAPTLMTNWSQTARSKIFLLRLSMAGVKKKKEHICWTYRRNLLLLTCFWFCSNLLLVVRVVDLSTCNEFIIETSARGVS